MSEEPKATESGTDPRVAALESKNAELVGEIRKLTERLQAFGDLTPETAAEAARKAREAEEAKLSAAGQFDELKKRLQEEHRTEREKLEKALQDREGRIHRLLVEDELSKALDAVGVLPDRKEYVRRYFLAEGPQVKEDRGVFTRSDGDVAILDAVKKWAESPEADAFVRGEIRNGTGGRPGDGAPGGKSWPQMTATEQAALWRQDPDRARAMAKEAGIQLAG